jgi:hypothetical protein
VEGNSCVAQATTNPFCLTFWGLNCRICVTGYFINNGICVSPNTNCLRSNATTKKCLSCYRSYFLANGQCLPVSPLCNGNTLDGSCIKCISGYTPKGNGCVTLISTNPFCLTFKVSDCVRCQNGYYLGPNSLCTRVNPLCRSYYMSSGICINCVYGSSRSNGSCFTWISLNPKCANFNNVTGSCLRCNAGYYLGTNKFCTQVNPLCRTYSMFSGKCYTCIIGYKLLNGSCIFNSQCAIFDNVTGNCLRCNNGYYIGPNKLCIQVNPLCKTYGTFTGCCYSCIIGYTLLNKTCIESNIFNPQCASFSNVTGDCL